MKNKIHDAGCKMHEDFMKIAISLARKGIGITSPNPVVGAVVVKNGRVIGKGYHKKAGLPHAEIIALNGARGFAKGADLYVTLEPCNHYGRTPPCTDVIIGKGVKRVFIGMKDPNPLVNGKGIRRLKKNRIEVLTGILDSECMGLNPAYIKHITTKTPFVTLKLASTLDGKIAAPSGESKWITSEKSREYVQKLRMQVDAIMVGIGTILKDDPLLTARPKNARLITCNSRQPLKVIVDSQLKIPLDSRVFDAKNTKLLIATTKNTDIKKIGKIEDRGADVIIIDTEDTHVDLKKLMKKLGRRGVTNILIEGGSRLAASAIKQGIVDKVLFFYAPILLGGDGIPMIGALGIKKVKDAIHFKNIHIKKIGEDILLEGDV